MASLITADVAAERLGLTVGEFLAQVEKGDLPKPTATGIGHDTTQRWRDVDLDRFVRQARQGQVQALPRTEI